MLYSACGDDFSFLSMHFQTKHYILVDIMPVKLPDYDGYCPDYPFHSTEQDYADFAEKRLTECDMFLSKKQTKEMLWTFALKDGSTIDLYMGVDCSKLASFPDVVSALKGVKIMYACQTPVPIDGSFLPNLTDLYVFMPGLSTLQDHQIAARFLLLNKAVTVTPMPRLEWDDNNFNIVGGNKYDMSCPIASFQHCHFLISP